nr:MAG TPA: hypothetical protein [Caudoviricetes sp.]
MFTLKFNSIKGLLNDMGICSLSWSKKNGFEIFDETFTKLFKKFTDSKGVNSALFFPEDITIVEYDYIDDGNGKMNVPAFYIQECYFPIFYNEKSKALEPAFYYNYGYYALDEILSVNGKIVKSDNDSLIGLLISSDIDNEFRKKVLKVLEKDDLLTFLKGKLYHDYGKNPSLEDKEKFIEEYKDCLYFDIPANVLLGNKSQKGAIADWIKNYDD